MELDHIITRKLDLEREREREAGVQILVSKNRQFGRSSLFHSYPIIKKKYETSI